MTPELYAVAGVILLAIVQIAWAGQARTAELGVRWNAGPRDEVMPPPGRLAGRLQRAQANLLETLPLFIGAVLIAHVAGATGPLTFWGAQLYLFGRIVYLPLYALGVPYVRSLVWVASIAGLLMIVAAVFL